MKVTVRLGLLAFLLFGLHGSTLADVMLPSPVATPLNQVGMAAMTVKQYAPDDTVVAKPLQLINGKTTTSWQCKTAAAPARFVPMRLVFDLGLQRTVGKVRIANYFAAAPPPATGPVAAAPAPAPVPDMKCGFKVVDVFVGDVIPPDDGGMAAVADKEVAISTATGTAWTDIALDTPVKGRYVTVRVKSNWGGDAYAANQVEIYTMEKDPPIIAVTQYDVDGKAVGKPKELVDHDIATRWNVPIVGNEATLLPVTLEWDLQKVETITEIHIANYSAPSHNNLNRGIKTVDIIITDPLAPPPAGTPTVADAVVTISDATGPVWTVIKLPKPVKGRYVTFFIKDNWGGKNYAANEVEFVTDPADTWTTELPKQDVP